jgi:peptide/nickel transport system permease protein
MTRALHYLLRRVTAGIFTMLVLIAIAFAFYWSTPTQPALFVYQPPPHHFTDYQIKQADHFLGLDRPKLTQYVDYVWGLLHGNFGPDWDTASYAFTQRTSMQPLRPVLMQELGVTLSLLLGGALLVLLLSVPLGAIAGSRIGSLSDRTISLIALIGVCTHPMVIGLLLRSLFGGRLHWAPESGYCTLTPSAFGLCGGPFDWASHLALPWVTFALLFLALYTRMVRTSVSETLHEDYIRTARAKGAREFTVIRRHVLPNASLRVMTMIGMEIGTTIGVCIFIETAYGLHGLAQAGLLAMVETQNLPTTLGVVTCVGLLVVVGGLLVDMLYAVVDPRAGSTTETRTKSLAGGVI